jgi:hypothetical protein
MNIAIPLYPQGANAAIRTSSNEKSLKSISINLRFVYKFAGRFLIAA